METSKQDHPIVIERTFNAPRPLVWDIFTKKEHIEKWWGPEGFTTRVENQDFRPGGSSRYVMVAPDGKEYPALGTFQEIDPIDRYTSTDDFGEEYMEVAKREGMQVPRILLMTYEFEDLGGQTKVTITATHPSEEDKALHAKMGAEQGWQSSFNKLDLLIEAMRA